MGNEKSLSKNFNIDDIILKTNELNKITLSDFFLKKTGYLLIFGLIQTNLSQIFHSNPQIKAEIVNNLFFYLLFMLFIK